MRLLDADTASPKRLNPPDSLPFQRITVGGRTVILRTRETIATMQRRYRPWSVAYLDDRQAGKDAEAARLAGDAAGVRAAEDRRAEASDRVERIHAALLMLAWWDPSGDLDVRERWDRAEFAGEAEPMEAVGAEVIDELMSYGWEPAHVNSAGAAVITGYLSGLGMMPDPKEVETLAEVFPQPTETPT